MSGSFKFPLIAFSSSVVHVARNARDLLICSKKALKDGFYKDLKIVDSCSMIYYIENASKLKPHGFFYGYNIFLNQKIEVELIIKFYEYIGLSDFKELVLLKLRENFVEIGGNYNHIANAIKSCTSIKAVIKHLTEWFYSEYN